MKMDSEANGKIFDLCVSSEKARTITEDLREMIDDITTHNLINCKDRILTYTCILFDYVANIDDELNKLSENSELI